MATTTSFDRDSQARWYARRHLDFDPEVVHIFHLPRNAKPREIRFLEVNRSIPELICPEPIDFGVALDGPDAHTLIVLDVTPAQWEAIERGTMPLPADWSLEGRQELGVRP